MVTFRAVTAARESRLRLEPDRGLAVDELLGAIHALRLESLGGAAAPETALRSAARGTYRLGAIVGIDGELWRGAIEGALGPRVGLRLAAPWRVASELLAGIAWGLNDATGLRATEFRISWTADYAPIAPLELGIGPDLVVLVANATGTPSSEQRGIAAGALAQARCIIGWGPLSFSAGPDLEVLAEPIVVQRANIEVFRVPNFVAGFSVNAEGEFVR